MKESGWPGFKTKRIDWDALAAIFENDDLGDEYRKCELSTRQDEAHLDGDSIWDTIRDWSFGEDDYEPMAEQINVIFACILNNIQEVSWKFLADIVFQTYKFVS